MEKTKHFWGEVYLAKEYDIAIKAVHTTKQYAGPFLRVSDSEQSPAPHAALRSRGQAHGLLLKTDTTH